MNKSCKDCKDRHLYCHSHCDRYTINTYTDKAKELIVTDYKYESVYRTMKRLRMVK